MNVNKTTEPGAPSTSELNTFPLWKSLVLPWSMVLFFFWPVFQGKIPLNADWLSANAVPWRSDSPIECYNPEMDDPVLEYYPLAVSAAGILREGRIPLWNPALGLGVPQLADFHSLPLDPIFFLVFQWVDQDAAAWGYFLLLQFLVLALVTAGFLKERGYSLFPVSWGTAALVFSGPCITRCELRTFTGTLIGLMWALWGVERFKKSLGGYTLPWMASGLALTVIGGHIQYTLYAWLITLAYFLFVTWHKSSTGRIFHLSKMLIFTGLLGALLSAFQWLPELELLTRAFRGEPGRYFSLYRFGLMPWISLVSPDFLGNPVIRSYFGLFIYYKSYVNLPVIYMGVPTFLMLLLALSKKGETRRFFGSMMLGILGFLSLLGLKPVRVWMNHLWAGLFDLEPGRAAMMVVVAGAVLAAEGAGRLVEEGSSNRSCRRVTVIWSVLLTFAVLISVLIFTFRARLALIAKDNSLLLYCLKVQEKHGTLLADRDVWKPLLFMTITVIILWLRTSIRLKGVMISLVLAVDLLMVAVRYNPMIPVSILKPPDSNMLSSVKTGFYNGRIAGIDSPETKQMEGETLPPDTAQLLGMYDLRLYMSAPPKRYSLFINNKNDRLYFDRRLTYDNRRIFDIAGVRWLLTPPDMVLEDVSPVYRGKRFRIYENQSAYPKVWFVEHVWPAESSSAMDIFSENKDMRRIALVEGLSRRYRFENSSKDKVTLVSADGTELIFSALTRAGGFAVVNELYYPGWQVRVNGKREDLFPVDGVFRGFFVPEGVSRIELIYRPVSFWMGLFVSVLMTAVCVAWIVFGGNKRLC